MSLDVENKSQLDYAPMTMQADVDLAGHAYTAMSDVASEPTADQSSNARPSSVKTPLEHFTSFQRGDSRLTGALLVGSLMLEEEGELTLECGSTYGAAVLLPQVARSAEWPQFLTFLAIRSFIFLLLGMSVQFYLLHLLSREEDVLNLFAGQMHLCDFGQGVRGPSGSIATPPRTYDFAQWVSRSFARDSLKALFPSLADDIDASMDAGEYALESFLARWVCCFVFMIATFQELIAVLRTCWLLYVIPTNDEPWICCQPGATEVSWLDRVAVRIAGMPALWKMLYSVFLVLPKFGIWKLCCQTGIGYLMETSTIEGLIVNSVALAFILNIDENLCATLMSEPVRVLMSKCESYKLYDRSQQENMSNSEILQRFSTKQRLENISARELCRWLPGKLFASVLVTFIFMADYYSRNCYTQDGVRVSRPLFLPKDNDQTMWETLLPNFFVMEAESEPIWTMPED
mmetsp:Transcript_98038/g.247401  ORF Transcript_98038/g.247401 Transcript_98038/m.247401 type:complete len:460 (+) Transcript_98038:114-1493(+)